MRCLRRSAGRPQGRSQSPLCPDHFTLCGVNTRAHILVVTLPLLHLAEAIERLVPPTSLITLLSCGIQQVEFPLLLGFAQLRRGICMRRVQGQERLPLLNSDCPVLGRHRRLRLTVEGSYPLLALLFTPLRL